MNYLNLSIVDLTSEPFLGSEPIDRATWLCLMRYCAQQETGGVIADAADWGDRKWMQLCGVAKEEVHADSLLWQWDGKDLAIAMYPQEQEATAKARREAGKRYGAGHPKGKQKDGNSSPNSPPRVKVKDKGNDKDKDNGKDNGKEKKPFTPPTIEEVRMYCQKRGNTVSPEKFVDHYTANGWRIGGKSPMKDWQAAVRTWEHNENTFKQTNRGAVL